MTDDDIDTWLSQVDDSPTLLSVLPRECHSPRKRPRDYQLPSPTMSHEYDESSSSSPTKRLRLDETPRALRHRPRSDASASASTGAGSSVSFASAHENSPTGSRRRAQGGRASPVKSFVQLSRDKIADFETLDGLVPPPPQLGELVQRIKEDARGAGIITEADQVGSSCFFSSYVHSTSTCLACGSSAGP
jgi:hypothetical protein